MANDKISCLQVLVCDLWSYLSALSHSYKASCMFGPVSLREQSDDADSLKGDLTFNPLYPYFGTLATEETKNETSN